MKLGIIGGSGLYDIESLEVIDTIMVDTPFGAPSDAVVYGKISREVIENRFASSFSNLNVDNKDKNNDNNFASNDTELYFLPRHGVGHKIAPHEINHRANIFAMKKLGVTHILSITAVGSLKEELAPKDIVFVDQYYDRTKQSEKHTFFGDGVVAHIPFGDPICNEFKNFAYNLSKKIINKLYGTDTPSSPKSVNGGTYVNMEGPAFSTKSESNAYRQFGFDIVGMTSLAEAKLSREAEICYCTAAMVTDYDCWRSGHDSVSADMVVNTMKSNVKAAKLLISSIAESFHLLNRDCGCSSALEFSIMTDIKTISDVKKAELAPITGKYI